MTRQTLDNSLFPVVLAVPEQERQLRGRDQVVFLSRYARQALQVSADRSAVRLESLAKDADGVPLPTNGIYWSITHKPQFVGAVVARSPVGIDLESIRPCSDKLFEKVGNAYEWRLSNNDRTTLFYRYWTSKETVLKATGVGFKGLSKCRVTAVHDDHHLTIDFQEQQWHIEHCFFNDHIVSVLKLKGGVEWTLLNAQHQPMAAEMIRASL
jgi:4'-phosphopantetheinyl transferase